MGYWKCLKCGCEYPLKSAVFVRGNIILQREMTCRKCRNVAIGDREIWKKFDYVEEKEDDEDEE